MSIRHICPKTCDVVGVFAFDIESAPKGKTDHFKTYLGTLVNSLSNGLRTAFSYLHVNRIISKLWRYTYGEAQVPDALGRHYRAIFRKCGMIRSALRV